MSSSQINLTWTASTDNVGVAGYEIWRDGAQIATSPTNSYNNVGLNASTTYRYRIFAYDAAGNRSGQSSLASATTLSNAGDTQAPSVPQNLSATTFSSTQINLTWSASTDNIGVVGYRIYMNGIHIANSSTTSYSNTGLSPQTTYTYRVVSYDAAGNNSGQSNASTATTSAGGNGGSNNHRPVLNHIGNKIVILRHLLSFKVSASDKDNDKLSFVAMNLPRGAKFNNRTGDFSWQPKHVGRYYVTFRVSDGSLRDSETIMIRVKRSGNNNDDNGNQYGIAVELQATRKSERSWLSQKDYGSINVFVNKGSVHISRIILYRRVPGEIFKAIKEFKYSGEGTLNTYDTYLAPKTVYTYKIMAIDSNNKVIASSLEVAI
jgi:chitodextrinase